MVRFHLYETLARQLISRDISQVSICLGQGVGREDRRKRLAAKRETLRELSEEMDTFCVFVGAGVTQVSDRYTSVHRFHYMQIIPQ